ncbi:putative Splicing factor 3B subunit 6 [Paratrimastix pyriformis]|uniref:Splicing factor 3B subunit 6 n=1 Tax=Paratrimastix pyriformis TaxID=342808 RepID=A0ABQ8UTM9_9EUKA|nr:putative Splicing factor 3B subunit 6 [Paratrimastix pyriformis]
MTARARANQRLPPEVNRILFVRNLPFKITSEEIYDIFGKFGAIRQIRLGNAPDTRGTAFVIYDDIYDAKKACEQLSGFSVANRYLIVLYYQQSKMLKRLDQKKREAENAKLRATLEKAQQEKKENPGA